MGKSSHVGFSQSPEANKPVALWLGLLGALVLYATYAELTLLAHNVGATPPPYATALVDPWALVPKKAGFTPTCEGTDGCFADAIFWGRGLAHFAWRVDNLTRRVPLTPRWRRGERQRSLGNNTSRLRLKLVVLGNSVARQNEFKPASRFVSQFRQQFPRVTFDREYGQLVKGGFQPEHLLHCGSRVYETADVVLIHYETLADKESARVLLERLALLPLAPLVVVIKHCQLPQMEALAGAEGWRDVAPVARSEWVRKFYCNDTAELFDRFKEIERRELELLREAGVTFVDSCAAVLSLLTKPNCALTLRDLPEVKLQLFTLSRMKIHVDGMHQSPLYSDLQGCLAAQAVLGSPWSEDPHAPAFVPVAWRSSKGHGAGDWCLEAGQPEFASSIAVADGWEMRSGGANGAKVWLGATVAGQAVEFLGNLTGRTLAIEYYAHDSLPMGTVEATLTVLHPNRTHAAVGTGAEGEGGTATALAAVVVDGRCTDCHRGQGFYKSQVLARELPAGEGRMFRLRLEVVPRRDGREGAAFHVVSLLMHSDNST